MSLDLHPGWTGIVGENGSGKSTLLGLISGALAPTIGTVEIEPEDAVMASCPQRLDAPTQAIHDLAAAWTRADIRLRARLGLEPEQLDRWPTLSPGERRRWQVGAALSARPDILLLDEPTNHLDAEARALLLDALAGFRGIGLVVSHDRTLLDALTSQTLRVHHGVVEPYRGAYAQARASWQERQRAQRQAHEQARQEERALERRLADQRRSRASAEHKLSVARRAKDKNDSDVRGMGAQNRVAWAEARLSRNVSLLRRAVDRASERTSALAVTRERGRSLFVDYQPAPRPYLASLDRAEITAGAAVILRDVRLALARDSRIHVAGPNGAGKSTLLGALLDAAAHAREHILYLPQVMGPDLVSEHLLAIRALDRTERGRIMQVAAALGLDPERVLATDQPSPGEIRKLALARGMGMGAWALVLDEPTNHLDLPSIERIESALADYPGALVLVSHDEPFARALTSTIWRLERGRALVESRPEHAQPLHAAE
ncbi:MAG TPA: ATP-binding cassette domain-containing protein [Haliangium sp.]|nr:ATP-binding cassette domain-containing protein [Haliangium sp.]